VKIRQQLAAESVLHEHSSETEAPVQKSWGAAAPNVSFLVQNRQPNPAQMKPTI
jgi:hypothetical protein